MNKKNKFKRIGLSYFASYNIYHILINMSWSLFIFLFVSYFFFVSLFFGLIYYLAEGNKIIDLKIKYNILIEKMFYTIQILTSGQAISENNLINVISTLASLIGMVTLAILVGVLYGRFSKPNAKLFFSKNIITTTVGKKTNYNIRIANAKFSNLIELNSRLIVLLNEKTKQGHSKRQSYYVDLVNNHLAFLESTWTLTHIADDKSPLYGLTKEDLIEKEAEFIFMINAIDDSYATQVNTQLSYSFDDVIENSEFESVFEFEKNNLLIDLKKISNFKFIN
jgi:inward rectifier potassium channel